MIERVNLHVYVSPGWIVCGTEQVPLPFRSIATAGPAPSGSSTSEVIVTGSVDTEVFFTSTVNCTGPPGSGTEVGSAVFVTSIDGATSVMSTSRRRCRVTGRSSSSCPVTVADVVVRVAGIPRDLGREGACGLVRTAGGPSSGASSAFSSVPQSPRRKRLPKTESVSVSIVTVSAAEVLWTRNVNVTLAPGSGTDVGEATLSI